MRTWLTAGVALLGLCAGLRADTPHWPHWRGPAASGVVPGSNLPTTWSDDDVLWRAPLAGLGVSSPVVWGNRVYVTSQAGDGVRRQGNHPSLVQGGNRAESGEGTLADLADRPARERVSFVVEAFDRDTGQRAWAHEMPAEGDLPPVHDKHNLASPSPVTDGERVYAWFGTGQIVALDTEGRPVWTRHLGQEIAPFQINWGHASSPVVFGDTLLLLCYHESASYLLALDKRTGRQRWKADREAGVLSYSTPTIVQGPSGPELIVNSSEGVEGFDPATGTRLWQFRESNRFPIPVAVADGDRIYLSRGYRSGPYMALTLGGRGDISKSHLAWHVPTGAPYIPSLVLYDGLIYMAGEAGVVMAVDARTGERVWQERIGGVFTASPVAGDGKIYLLSETGETVVLKAGRTPEVLARNAVAGHFVASPAVAGGRIFLRADNSLVAVGR